MTDFQNKLFRKRSRSPLFKRMKAAHKAGLLSIEELALFGLAAQLGTFSSHDLMGDAAPEEGAYTRTISLLRYWRGDKDRHRGVIAKPLIMRTDFFHSGGQGKPLPVYELTAAGLKLYKTLT
ncbi:hypothetical protein [Zhongshania sp.]|uniref:hypothetical protein n=1 Tax=Zhongshania sp. TaxID=1971902 RepID=UPI003564D0F5